MWEYLSGQHPVWGVLAGSDLRLAAHFKTDLDS